MNLAVAGAAAPAHGGDGRSARKVEREFFLKGVAEFIALEFIKQLLERRTEGDLVDWETPRGGNFRIVGIDRGERLRAEEAGHDQMLEWFPHQRRCAERLEPHVVRHFLLSPAFDWAR